MTYDLSLQIFYCQWRCKWRCKWRCQWRCLSGAVSGAVRFKIFVLIHMYQMADAKPDAKRSTKGDGTNTIRSSGGG